MYAIKEMSPGQMPKKPRPILKTPLSTRPYFNEPTSMNDYIYQQSLKPKQTPIPWRLIPIDMLPKKPTRRPEDLPPIPYDPRLDLQFLQDLEEMNRQLLAELEVSSSDSSPDSTPHTGPNKSARPPRRLADTRSNISIWGQPPRIIILKIIINLFRKLIQMQIWLSETSKIYK